MVNQNVAKDPVPVLSRSAKLKTSVSRALDALIADQHPDGHWRYNLDSFVFGTAFHLMTLHYIGETPDLEMNKRFGNYLRRHQLPTGGWGTVPNGDVNIDNSVVVYMALRLLGDKPNQEHMRRASKAILKNGGIEGTNCNVRIYLALYGIIPWNCVPTIPVEIMLLPDWFPVTIYKMGYWARVPVVAMSVVQALKRPARISVPGNLEELFLGKPANVGSIQRSEAKNIFWFWVFTAIDKVLKIITPFFTTAFHEKATRTAVEFCIERLNGTDGYGSVTPSMYYALMMFDALGYSEDNPHRAIARKAINKLEVVQEDEAFLTVVLSPVWDTALAIDALLETGEERALEAAEKGLIWLRPLQVREFKGDWALRRPAVQPGGWAFYYKNPHYPDTDDTEAVLTGMQRMAYIKDSSIDHGAISAGTNWILGMQSSNGGWGSYDAENTQTYINHIPLVQNDSFLDEPTADVTGGIVHFLALSGLTISNSIEVRRAVEFLMANQEKDGSWYGRWGVNYIYGTKLALCALVAAGIPRSDPCILRAVDWLISIQKENGGWGESVDSYEVPRCYRSGRTTASQTAWAILGLMAATEVHNPAISSGVDYLLETQNAHGQWDEEEYTGTGHPGIIYFRYNGYKNYFTLMALARYLNKKAKFDNQMRGE